MGDSRLRNPGAPPPSRSGRDIPEDIPTRRQVIRPVGPEATTATVRCFSNPVGDTPDERAHRVISLNEIVPNPAVEHSSRSFPEIGSKLLHFQLIEELGRGAFARVYLARQEALANRLVVLKVTTARTDEPQTLARLGHTNIVPVYSVHEAGVFHVVCMPYLGRTTLGQLFSRVMADQSVPPVHGRAFLEALGHALPGHDLGRFSYEEGCLWIVGQLAAGLAHAHSRGVLHQDLKPANVLVTDDGVPMILDFNVASDAGKPSHSGLVGGTLPYMAAEHLLQFLDKDARVDERSDLFSLGIILYQLLSGELPYPVTSLPDRDETIRRMIEQRSSPPVSIRKHNPAVSPAMAAIVSRLLEPSPENRYRSAESLHEDIGRQLAHLPLSFAPDRSLPERCGKWRKRHPKLAASLAAALATCLLVLLPLGWLVYRHQQAAELARQFQKAEAVIAADAAIGELRNAAIHLGSLVDPAMREQGLWDARAIIARYELTSPDWQSRPAFALLDPARQASLGSSLAETLVLMTRAEAAAGRFSPASIEAGLRWNAIASTLFADEDRPMVLARHRAELEALRSGPPPVLSQSLGALSGQEKDADFYFDGLDLAAAGKYREALPRLARYSDRHPTHFRAWFARGICHDVLGQPADAAAAFSVCLALLPDFPLAVANHGIARLKQKRLPEAEADFTHALELQPGWTLAHLNRGIARLEQRNFAAAETDFSQVLGDPACPTRVYLLRSLARRGKQDLPGAEADRKEGLTRTPNDALSWATRGRWRMDQEPRAALADFDAALKLDPSLRDALLNRAIVLADHLHQEREAIDSLDRLLAYYPDHVEARASRGVYLARIGRVAEARRDARDALAAEQTAYRKYQIAGLHAQIVRHEPNGPARSDALRFLALALRSGFDDMKLLQQDTDLDPIRSDPEFQRLTRLADQFVPRSR
jgi:serine/threonine protein kinase/Flp pilus assembly protein TadD